MHCQFPDSSLQKPQQHQSARAHFNAYPQLGPFLLSTLAVLLRHIQTFSAYGQVAKLHNGRKRAANVQKKCWVRGDCSRSSQQHFCFQLFPAFFGHSKPFSAIQRNVQSFKYISVHVQTFPDKSCQLQLFLAHSSHFLFWNDWLWVCVSEALCNTRLLPLGANSLLQPHSEWLKMASNGSKWLEIALNISKLVQIVFQAMA